MYRKGNTSRPMRDHPRNASLIQVWNINITYHISKMEKGNMIISMNEEKSCNKFKSSIITGTAWQKASAQILSANLIHSGSMGTASPWDLELDKDALSPPEKVPVSVWGWSCAVDFLIEANSQNHQEVSDEDRGVRKVMTGTFNSGYQDMGFLYMNILCKSLLTTCRFTFQAHQAHKPQELIETGPDTCYLLQKGP